MRWESLIDENFAAMYRSACKYHSEHGDLLVPNAYIDENGVHLGEYIHYLRESVRKKRSSFLTDEQRKMLTEIGMDWTWSKEQAWDENYALLAEFMSQNPNKPVPADLKTVTGGSLRNWKASQISAYRSGKLSSERIGKLELLGINLSVTDRWMKAYSYAVEFYEKHRHTNFPNNCVVEGIWMSGWWETQVDSYFGRNKRRLTAEQRSLLETLNIQNHRSVAERRWYEYYDSLQAYYAKHGNIAVPEHYTAGNKGNMRRWIQAQRKKHKEMKLTAEKIALLDSLGIIWTVDLFQDGLDYAKTYAKEFGNLRVSANYACPDGYELGKFLLRMRQRKRLGTLSQNQIDALNAIGMVWNAQDERFYAALQDCKDFYAEHGHLQIPPKTVGKSGVKRNYWLADCRRKLRQGKLSADKAALLREAHIMADSIPLPPQQIDASKPLRLSDSPRAGNTMNG